MASICLCMIIKNEEAIILRCLNSLLPYIDTYVICDTGSTDSTVQLVETFFAKTKLQGTVCRDTWSDFATNRNLCLKRAADSGTDFCFMVDADEVLEVSDKQWKHNLNKQSVYSIYTGSRSFVYAVPVITPTKLEAHYIGVTHEYLNFPNNTAHNKIDKIRLHHVGDGGSKKDKLERDKSLIEQAMRTEARPFLIQRYLFYLAQTCFDMHNYEKAIFYYRQRIKHGGWEEEVFYCYYKCGLALLAINNWQCTDKVVRWLFRAWQFRRTRLEPLYAIMKHCGDKKMAAALAQAGAPVKMTTDVLFVEKNIYEYDYEKLLREITLCY